MKRIFITLVVSCNAFFAMAQHLPCGSDAKRRELIHNHPEILQQEADHELITNQLINQQKTNRANQQIYTIPVVFHIIHQNGAENISDAQVIDAVNILNRDYRKLNADTAAIVHGFDTLCADAGIEFRLATIDPLGNCTNGIERIYSTETYVGDDGSKLHAWPRNKYLNVWVVAQMENGVAGYAYYPSSVAGGFMAFVDGVIILHNYVGSIGTSNPGTSRALTHEVGHWLNLQHPWGNNNDPGVICGDDLVDDTPITKGWTSCNLNGNVCIPGIYENVQNYMDYSYCSVMFTQGQVDRMRAALIDNTADRSNLWTTANLIATGVEPGTELSCAPKADFYPAKPTVCLNENIVFYDNTMNGAATSWQWTFQDGNPATSTVQDPTVSFGTPGWKTVSLTVSNAEGTDSRTITNSIYVSNGLADYGTPYWESFEWYLPFAEKWIVRNRDNNETYFQLYHGAGYTGDYCIMLNNASIITNPFDDGAKDIDELITPSFNLTAVQGSTLNFRYASSTNAMNADDITETLKIYSSTDCGQTWILRKTITGLALATGQGAGGSSYVPVSATDWAYEAVNISASLAQPDIRFKFEYVSSAYSNNLFIDDINIATTTGIDEQEELIVDLFPNPSSEMFTINSNTPGTKMVKVYSATGEIVHDFSMTGISATVDCSKWSAGVYLVSIQANGGTFKIIRYLKF